MRRPIVRAATVLPALHSLLYSTMSSNLIAAIPAAMDWVRDELAARLQFKQEIAKIHRRISSYEDEYIDMTLCSFVPDQKITWQRTAREKVSVYLRDVFDTDEFKVRLANVLHMPNQVYCRIQPQRGDSDLDCYFTAWDNSPTPLPGEDGLDCIYTDYNYGEEKYHLFNDGTCNTCGASRAPVPQGVDVAFVDELSTKLRKLEMDRRQNDLQNNYCDPLYEEIKSELLSAAEIKYMLRQNLEAHGPRRPVEVLIWSAADIIFKPHSALPNRDCRDERFRETNMTVEEAAKEQDFPLSFSGKSMYSIFKYTDVLALLAAKGIPVDQREYFTCELYTSYGKEMEYWTPVTRRILLRFWGKKPDGSSAVPAHLQLAKDKALAGWNARHYELEDREKSAYDRQLRQAFDSGC